VENSVPASFETGRNGRGKSVEVGGRSLEIFCILQPMTGRLQTATIIDSIGFILAFMLPALGKLCTGLKRFVWTCSPDDVGVDYEPVGNGARLAASRSACRHC
jgi:hypothetical protein